MIGIGRDQLAVYQLKLSLSGHLEGTVSRHWVLLWLKVNNVGVAGVRGQLRSPKGEAAVVIELVTGGCHEILYGHRFAAADDLDQVVGAGEDPV